MANRRDPHICVAEFTSQVEWRPRTVRKKMPQRRYGHPPEDKKHHAQHGDGHPVPAADPYVEFIFAKVGNVGQKFGRVVVHGLTCEDPTHVSPETAVARRVRVTLLVRVLVMHAMCGDPEDWAAFQSERAAHGEEILHPPGRLVAAMRQQAMVAHPDAEASGDPPQHHREEARFPAEHEQRSHGADVKCHHNEGGDPHDGLSKRPVAFEEP